MSNEKDDMEKVLTDVISATKKANAYADVRSGDDLWWLDVVTTLCVDGKLSCEELDNIIVDAVRKF